MNKNGICLTQCNPLNATYFILARFRLTHAGIIYITFLCALYRRRFLPPILLGFPSTMLPPVTIYLQAPDSQPGLHLIAQAARMREARMTCASKDYSVRCKVRQPFSHSQRSICAGRTTILKTSKRSRHRTDGQSWRSAGSPSRPGGRGDQIKI